MLLQLAFDAGHQDSELQRSMTIQDHIRFDWWTFDIGFWNKDAIDHDVLLCDEAHYYCVLEAAGL